MNILSFTYWDGCHDTSAAIVCDGVLVAAVEEERFTRRKHEGSFPFQAIDFCLRCAGIDMQQVDLIAFPDQPFRSGRDSGLAEMELAFVRRLKAENKIRFRSLAHKLALDAYLRLGFPSFNFQMDPIVACGLSWLRTLYGDLPPIRYYDHHRSHAAATYFTSEWSKATVITIDGRGGSYATVIWSADGNKITRLCAEPYTNSLGVYYDLCTQYLGLGEFGDGKLMGLASYGNEETFAKQVSSMLDTSDDAYHYRRSPSEELLGFPSPHMECLLEPPYPDFAAACQNTLEYAVARVVRLAIDKTKEQRICLGGGVMYNCSSNGSLRASKVASSVWIFPASGDAGLSIGAALLCAAEAGELRCARLDNAYWGPAFSPAECKIALSSQPMVTYRRHNDIAEEVARYLAKGEIVGWFQGRMELGPRALGNRSVLADPCSISIRDRVNRIKGREFWRPLAPVVLAEHASDYFTLNGPSPFMLFATQVRSEKRSVIPGVVHVDGSARPQTVTRDQNPLLYDLITAFYRKTGVPVLLNTSFNAAGEPIVCTPQDAVNTFLRTGIDVLILGDYVVRRTTSDS
jgi:carbamoyltransferase